MSPEWICSQIGAREHYAVARALHQSGKLAALHTDFWAGPATRKILAALHAPGSLATRFHPDLSDARVCSHNLRSIAWEIRLRQKAKAAQPYLGFCDVGRRFALAVLRELQGQALSPRTIFFGYDTGALETLDYLRKRGVPCVVDQMDPNRVEVDLVRAEEKRWPGWALRETNVPEDYFRRREQEWALADSIVVNSEFSRQALIRQGVPAGKLTVIPLCYETEDGEPKAGPREAGTTFSHQRPLKILFLGQVILRKGVQYLIEAAKLLSGEPVRFDIVGPIGIREEALRSVPANLTFHGRAVRDQAAGWYRQADLFVLPTLSDGFALTQIEAMAHGLPVIATPNCGDVVTPGVDGQIVPAGDAKALADAIMGYVKQSGLLADQREAALRKAGQFTLPHLAKNLAALETRLLSRS